MFQPKKYHSDMTIQIHKDLEQGSDEWFQARLGLLTASEMKLIITPTLKIADNDKTRAHLYELLAQRVTQYTEPSYISDDMMRGKWQELDARLVYEDLHSKVETCGFITNDKWGFTLGCSPDGLVGDEGLIEIKSRRAKFQVKTILNDKVPDEYMIQLQTGLLVSERKWCDFISYSGGMHFYVKRVEADEKIQDAIIAASTSFHEKMDNLLAEYKIKTEKLFLTERKIEEEMF